MVLLVAIGVSNASVSPANDFHMFQVATFRNSAAKNGVRQIEAKL